MSWTQSSKPLASLLLLPDIRSIYAYDIGDPFGITYGLYEWPQDLVSRLENSTSSVRHLELRFCKLSFEHTGPFVKTCKSLNTFVYEVKDLRALMRLNLRRITNLLSQHAAHLTHLCLSYRHRNVQDGECSVLRLTFDSFTSLKQLRIAACFVDYSCTKYPTLL